MSNQTQQDMELRVEVWKVYELLSEQRLRIPDYQRPYKWEIRNVAQLIDDIQEFIDQGVYRLGSVILHEDEDDRLNIVDGQQRFITLVLLCHALTPDFVNTNQLGVYEVAEFGLQTTRERLIENFRYIEETVAQWGADERERFTTFLLQSCETVVLTLSNVDEAFQMFDSQNTRGKALDPTDLLKAYHIREMDSDALDEGTKRRMVSLWEEIRPVEISALFADYLFKIKRWSAGRNVPDIGFRVSDIDTFKGIRQGDPDNTQNNWARPLLYAKNFTEDFRDENAVLVRFGVLRPVEFPHQIDQPVINGETFFTAVRHYHDLATRYGLFGAQGRLDDLPPEIAVLDGHRNDPRYGLIRNLFDALLLYYVDRFGEQELPAAARMFARYVVAFRAEHYAVKRSMVNRHALGTASDENLFREIRDSIRPRELLRRSIPQPQKPKNVRAFGDFDVIVPEIWKEETQ